LQPDLKGLKLISQNSISRVERLTKRAEYLAARNGKKRRGKYFLLEVLDRRDCENDGELKPPRIGFTVTKRQGNAVKRNRIRRRLKEAVRLKAHEFLLPGFDYVLIGHDELLDASFNDLIYSLEQRFKSKKNSDRNPRTGVKHKNSVAECKD
jgi:ribonuclease P protein component